MRIETQRKRYISFMMSLQRIYNELVAEREKLRNVKVRALNYSN